MCVLEDFDNDLVGLISDSYRDTSAFGALVEFVPDSYPNCTTAIINSI